MFVAELADTGTAPRVGALRVELFGSLGATGHGHGSVGAVILGLLGHAPEQVEPAAVQGEIQAVRDTGKLDLPGGRPVAFSVDDDIVLHRRERLEFHTNGMRFLALDDAGTRCAAGSTSLSEAASSSARTRPVPPPSSSTPPRCPIRS